MNIRVGIRMWQAGSKTYCGQTCGFIREKRRNGRLDVSLGRLVGVLQGQYIIIGSGTVGLDGMVGPSGIVIIITSIIIDAIRNGIRLIISTMARGVMSISIIIIAVIVISVGSVIIIMII